MIILRKTNTKKKKVTVSVNCKFRVLELIYGLRQGGLTLNGDLFILLPIQLFKNITKVKSVLLIYFEFLGIQDFTENKI